MLLVSLPKCGVRSLKKNPMVVKSLVSPTRLPLRLHPISGSPRPLIENSENHLPIEDLSSRNLHMVSQHPKLQDPVTNDACSPEKPLMTNSTSVVSRHGRQCPRTAESPTSRRVAGHYNRAGVHSASKDRIKNCEINKLVQCLISALGWWLEV